MGINKVLILIFLFILFLGTVNGAEIDRASILIKIAKNIEALKKDYPQLVAFKAPNSFKSKNYDISYAYKTVRAPKTGGWTSGVPHPTNDGVWFYISIHDVNSTRQIHTQPEMFKATYIGKYQFQLLLLQGKNTKNLNSALWNTFRKHGVKDFLEND